MCSKLSLVRVFSFRIIVDFTTHTFIFPPPFVGKLESSGEFPAAHSSALTLHESRHVAPGFSHAHVRHAASCRRDVRPRLSVHVPDPRAAVRLRSRCRHSCSTPAECRAPRRSHWYVCSSSNYGNRCTNTRREL